MKIGIVYYSHTGHTRQVGEAIQKGILQRGRNQVSLVGLEPLQPFSLAAESALITNSPEIESFDLLILGTPVHGGRLSGPLYAFLDNVTDFDGKPIIAYATHFFRRAWGTEQTLSSLAKLCNEKGARVVAKVDVRCPFRCPRKRVLAAVEKVLQSLPSA